MDPPNPVVLNLGVILPPGDTGQCQEAVLLVTHQLNMGPGHQSRPVSVIW